MSHHTVWYSIPIVSHWIVKKDDIQTYFDRNSFRVLIVIILQNNPPPQIASAFFLKSTLYLIKNS